jgi:hypothetical protein
VGIYLLKEKVNKKHYLFTRAMLGWRLPVAAYTMWPVNTRRKKRLKKRKRAGNTKGLRGLQKNKYKLS